MHLAIVKDWQCHDNHTKDPPPKFTDLSDEDTRRLVEHCEAEQMWLLYSWQVARRVYGRALRHLVVNGRYPDDLFDPADMRDIEAAYLTPYELDQIPDPEPLIPGWINRHTYVIIRGRDGTFKTFIVLDWALCLATGKPWQGIPVERVKVLYIAGEGAYGLAARIAAWEQAWGIEVDEDWFTVRTSAVNLFRTGPDFDELLERAGEYGLIVLDTLRRHSGGADANSSDMGTVVDNIERLKRATDDGTVITLAHTGKTNSDTRGFSGIEDDSDTVLAVKRDGMQLELECTKQKDGPDGFKLLLEMHPSLDSLIVAAASEHGADGDLNRSEQVLMMAMDGMFKDTGASITDLIETTELSKASLYRARASLLKAGRLISVGNKGRQRLELP